MRNLFFILTFFVCASSYSQEIYVSNLQKIDRPHFDIYFDLGQYQLSSHAKRTIDSLIYNDELTSKRAVSIIGYADVVGEDNSNKTLSEKRAKAVAEYLHGMGIDDSHVESVTGNGAVKKENRLGGYPEDRKVSIFPGRFDEADSKPNTDTSKLLATIYFQFSTAMLSDTSMPALKKLHQKLKDNPKLNVRLEGYVCCYNLILNKPSDPYETSTPSPYHKRLIDELTVDRARAIYSYLVRNGIDSTRLTYKGMTGANPLVIKGKRVCGLQRQRVEARIIQTTTP